MKSGEHCCIFGQKLLKTYRYNIQVKDKNGKKLMWSISSFMYDQIMKFKENNPYEKLVIKHGEELLFIDSEEFSS